MPISLSYEPHRTTLPLPRREARATYASLAGGAPGSPELSVGENRKGAPSPGRRSVRSDRAGSLGTKEEVSLPTNAPTPRIQRSHLWVKVSFAKQGWGDLRGISIIK